MAWKNMHDFQNAHDYDHFLTNLLNELIEKNNCITPAQLSITSAYPNNEYFCSQKINSTKTTNGFFKNPYKLYSLAVCFDEAAKSTFFEKAHNVVHILSPHNIKTE